jgi:preprotein translocase SecE subunit
MAVAVKNTPEVRTPSLLDRMPVVSLIGAAYVIGCLAVLGKGVPYLWWEVLGLDEASMMNSILLLMVLAAAAFGLGFVGLKLLGTWAPAGTRAGIFVAALGVLLILLLTRWASLWIEYYAYNNHTFSATVGAGVTAAIGVVLLAVGGYWFMDRRFEPYLLKLEEQGWFSATVFKGQQGVKVRRGTIFGMLLIVGSGIWTLVSNHTLERGPADYQIDIPFTAQLLVTNDTRGDVGAMLDAGLLPADLVQRIPPLTAQWDPQAKQLKQPVWLDRYALRDVNDDLRNYVRIVERGIPTKEGFVEGAIVSKADFDKEVEYVKENGVKVPTSQQLRPAGGDDISNYVKIRSRGDATNPAIEEGKIVPVAVFAEEVRKLKELPEGVEVTAAKEQVASKKIPTAVPVALGTGTEHYQSLTLLPSVQYTVPLLLIAATLWLAWRAVNFPVFADFLIATEAELNKVSWTTRRRLMQDTVVVLATVLLMAVFLFAMDMAWSHLLSWDVIGVIRKPKEDTTTQKPLDNRPW